MYKLCHIKSILVTLVKLKTKYYNWHAKLQMTSKLIIVEMEINQSLNTKCQIRYLSSFR